MNVIADQSQREAAINPDKSFIVQAPAGSGKTELLTQRFLVLLAKVKRPEDILAITFTKKSAAEMRARIINALQNASTMPEPDSTHAKTTWNLAKAALANNAVLNWNLLENPNRLRIQTIDSFNSYLTKQLPILSHFGAPPEIMDDATELYRSAVHEFLIDLEKNMDWSNAIAQLLLHLDNDLNKVQKLLINLLEKRDQWLPYITFNANDPHLRAKLEKYLENVSLDALTHLQECFPKEFSVELISLANFAANNLIRDNSDSYITHCSQLTDLPSNSIHDKKAWLGLSELLLTKESQWRKQLNKLTGFPSATSTKNRDEKILFDDLKKRLLDLINALQSHPKLFTAFIELRQTPENQYQESQWELLESLHYVLRIVVAQLKVVFQQTGKIDYIENAQGALAALGTDENPTDLVLALDYQLRHILIDEFQDTSTNQYRLIEKLTAGWTKNDGRTLFVVGDPMQSIYRFREAEVGYFIRARQVGVNHITLEPLTLSVNFRSVPGIVDWVNQYFPKIFPRYEDIATGAVAYSSSIATLEKNEITPVTLHAYLNSESTVIAKNIVVLIQQIKEKNPTETIAILVRSRTHLSAIIPALKSAGLPYKAIDIDPLTTRPVIQDLIALTRALLHPADRIAWLAVLRAPWCGLLLNDLLLIAGESPGNTIWEQLQKSTTIQSLSLVAQQRLAIIMPILREKIADRHRYALRTWLESTWILIGGPACTANPSDLDDAKAYFNLLEKLDASGELLNLDELEQYVSRLFAAPNNLADDTLQIMTIHNAKGLEFDTVILPHLERKSPNDDKQLLLWMERPQAQLKNALLIAPIHATGNVTDSIYDYIKRQHTIKNDYESARLLYVATTRAKKRLHLFFSLQQDNDTISNPAPNSLLDKLWNGIAPEVLTKSFSHLHKVNFTDHSSMTDSTIAKEKKTINRLSLEWINPISTLQTNSVTYHHKSAGFQLTDHNPKLIGVFLHQLLQQISLQGLTWWKSFSLEQQQSYCERHLIQLGMLISHVAASVEKIILAIKNISTDIRGKWIMHPHQDAKCELALTAIIDSQIKSLVIDRTFIDESGIRWIIDYKTSAPAEGINLAEFLKAEKEKYANQLAIYAKAMQEIDQRPVRLGLYFPLIPAWEAWE